MASSADDHAQPTFPSTEELDVAADAAAAAFAAAADLDALAAAKTAHLGDRSPIALARRALGSLPKDQRSEAGKLVNQVRGRVSAVLDGRTAQLQAERNSRSKSIGQAKARNAPSATPASGWAWPCTLLWDAAVSSAVQASRVFCDMDRT